MQKRENGKEKDGWNMPDKRQFFILIPFALLYALFIVLGDWDRAETRSGLHNLGSLLLWTLLAYIILFFLCFVISQRRNIMAKIPLLARVPAQKKRKGHWYVFLIFFVLCLAAFLPYFLMFYPTGFNNDAVWQLEQALGWVPRSNHHPWFHTLIIKFFFMIGYRLCGTHTDALAFYTFWQMAVMSAAFAFALYYLYKNGTRIPWLVAAFVFYALLPVNATIAISITKDGFFGAAMLVFSCQTAELIEQLTDANEENTKKSIWHDIIWYAGYFAIGICVCLLRSNGIFVYAGTVFFFALIFLRRRAAAGVRLFPADFCKTTHFKSLLCIAAVLLCYVIYHGPLLKAMDVEPPDTIEALTMPTQHILCAYVKGGELTEEEIAMIDRVMPADQAATYYNPYLFDIVKGFIRDAGNQEVIAQQKWDYFKLWLHVGLRNPLRYLEAEVKQTAGYWAYDVADYQYVVIGEPMVDNPFGITAQRKVFTYHQMLAAQEALRRFQDIYNQLWSLGRCTWIMLFCMAYAVYHKKSVMLFVPSLMLLVSLLLAVPVYHMLRYIYGIFIALPVFLEYSIGRDRDLGE